MRIRFKEPPAYVCENQHKHLDAHLEVFNGLELDGAERTQDGTMFRVSLQAVFMAFPLRLDTLVGRTFWRWHWLTEGLGLDNFVYFPADCVEVIQ